jgi:hypothetical protein
MEHYSHHRVNLEVHRVAIYQFMDTFVVFGCLKTVMGDVITCEENLCGLSHFKYSLTNMQLSYHSTPKRRNFGEKIGWKLGIGPRTTSLYKGSGPLLGYSLNSISLLTCQDS